MLNTSARLLRLLSLMQSRRAWSGSELAEELSITERTLRRDMERLRDLGYPVHATAGVGGGYRLGAGKELPPLPLEDDEAVAVAVGLRLAATGPVRGLELAAVRALAKLEAVLPRRLRRQVNALQSVSVQLQDTGPKIDAAALAVLANACRDAVGLRFSYRDYEGKASLRAVEPYRLAHTNRRWYLLGYDTERSAWRTFRVDRIAPAVELSGKFRPRPLPSDDIAGYVSQGVTVDAYPYKARALFLAPASALAPRVSGGGRVEALDEGRCVVHLGGYNLDDLALYLGFLGYPFEVLEPPALVENLRRLVARMGQAVGLAEHAAPAPTEARRKIPPQKEKRA